MTLTLQMTLRSLNLQLEDVGLLINVHKTKYMTFNTDPNPSLNVKVKAIKLVSNFRSLGSWVTSSESDFKHRKSLAWNAFWKLEKLWRSTSVNIKTKVAFFRPVVYPSSCMVANLNIPRHG